MIRKTSITKPMSRAALAVAAIMGANAMAFDQTRADEAYDPERAQPGANGGTEEWTLEGDGAFGGGGPDDQDGFHGQLGGGVVYGPQYKESSDKEVMPIPMVSLRYNWGERYVALDGPSLKANIISGAGFEFGPLVTMEMGRDDDIDNLAVARLGEIDDAVMAGIFFSTEIDLGGEGPGLQLGGQVLTDMGDTNEGVVAKFEAGYNWTFGESWMLMVGASATWADENYMQTYFGVTPAGALASGLPVYSAGAGIENVELSTGLVYRIDEDWSIMAFTSYQRLLDSAADSPVVQHGGSEDQLMFALAVGWEF